MNPENELLSWALGALGGLAIGIERQWSARREGSSPPFAGVRTFLLLGLLGALSGSLVAVLETRGVGLALLGAGLLLIVSAYLAAATRGSLEATTEVAGLVVLAAGALAGLGFLQGASAVFALTALVLVEKSRLHRAVERLAAPELEAAFRFAVMALVVLPLLPDTPYGPEPGIVPRRLWTLVLVFAGVSFSGYLAMKWLGPGRGPTAAGFLGGLVSSTAVTLEYSRRSRSEPDRAPALGWGILAANAVLPFRVCLLATVVHAPLGEKLILPMLPALGIAGLLLVRGWLQGKEPKTSEDGTTQRLGNPFGLRASMEMALLFSGVLLVLSWMNQRFGEEGLIGSAALVGTTDLDSLVFSLGRLAGASHLLETSVRALLVGLLSNTVFKAGAALVLGQRALRRIVGLGLLAFAAAFLLGLILFSSWGR